MGFMSELENKSLIAGLHCKSTFYSFSRPDMRLTGVVLN